jgi:hypothetical protein
VACGNETRVRLLSKDPRYRKGTRAVVARVIYVHVEECSVSLLCSW